LFLCVCLAVVCAAADAAAGTLRVCASGCTYTDLQSALNAAQYGDTILLRAGETFVGHYTLPAKSGSGWITIRSDAADSQLPQAGTRLIPSDRAGANTSRSLLPHLIGKGGVLKTTPILRTAAGAHGYKVQYLEFDGVAHIGYETLVALGDDTTAAPAYDLVLDHVYIHGDKYKGQKRAISLNSGRTTISDSYIADIKAVNADAQAIAAYNGTGPYTIVNNYLEAAGENILFGGSGPAITNLVPADASIRQNLITKSLTWRNDILNAPTNVKATGSGGGSLSAGTHYFRIVAMMSTGTRTAYSLPSASVSATTGSGGQVTLTWSAVPGADHYRIHRGTSAGGENVYLTAGAVTSYVYKGSGETSGKPGTTGTKWTVKNIFEVKNGERITLDGNIFENIWQSGQFGYALVLTPRNSSGTCTWCRVKDIVFTNNIVRHAAGVINIAAYDDTAPSGRLSNVTLRNNLLTDIDPKVWGGSAKVFLLQNGPSNIVIDANTIVHTNSSVLYASGSATASGLVYTNNSSRHGTYGIMGGSTAPGTSTITHYFPGANVTCNVLAGGKASSYPTPNAFPTETQWMASFVNFAAGDYRVQAGSVLAASGCSGIVPGVNFTTFNAAQQGASAPPPTSPPPPTGTNTPPVADAGGPYSASLTADAVVNGSGSSDPDGTIAAYRWAWGEQILVRADALPASAVHGSEWRRVAISGAAGGLAMDNPDQGRPKRSTPYLTPSSYVEFTVPVAANVPYQLWMRMRAAGDSYNNDSLYVQFSGSVDASGHATARIGTGSAVTVILEEGQGAGVRGWGWNDSGYGSLGAPIYFASSGTQTVRVQMREDGISWDQFILTSASTATTRPGAVRSDSTILATTYGTSSGVTTSHRYVHGGVYPLTLTVVDDKGAAAADGTTVAVGGPASTTTTLVARAGGPYSGSVNTAVSFNASGSTAPAGSTYAWNFGDDIVLHASSFSVTGSGWQRVSDPAAADGVAVDNPDRGAAKISTASASPSSYVEATFHAAAGVPYRVWVRARAAGNSWANDSIYLQFSGSTTSSGGAAWRIGTSQALGIVLEDGSGAGVSGWGWADAGYGTLADPIYFNQDGVQTLRIQQREDGMRIDQIVISTDAYYDTAPGSVVGDSTIVPVAPADGRTVSTQHAYRRAGTYPVTVKVTSGGSVSEDRTTAVIK
jgi:hypothetical protein